jgi:hypothetical protein
MQDESQPDPTGAAGPMPSIPPPCSETLEAELAALEAMLPRDPASDAQTEAEPTRNEDLSRPTPGMK